MRRKAWKSGKGEPLALVEVAAVCLVPAALTGLALALAGCDTATILVVLATVYLVLDRVAVLVDWAREVRAARKADRAFLAELSKASVRAHMAQRARV